MLGEAWPQLSLSLWERRGDTGFNLCQKSRGPPTTNHRCILSVCITRGEHPRWGQTNTLNKAICTIFSLLSCINLTAPFSEISFTSSLLVGHVNKHAWILVSQRVWKSTWSLRTDGNKLTRLNWMNGCLMCNGMTTWVRAFVWRMCC